MTESLSYQQMGTAERGQEHALFSQTMGYVAATAGLFALGAWLGRNITGGVGIVAFIAAFACLIGMRFSVKRSVGLSVGLLAVLLAKAELLVDQAQHTLALGAESGELREIVVDCGPLAPLIAAAEIGLDQG